MELVPRRMQYLVVRGREIVRHGRCKAVSVPALRAALEDGEELHLRPPGADRVEDWRQEWDPDRLEIVAAGTQAMTPDGEGG
jgi:hypothetical protein